jgi:small nuclear ribonucleoprotein (snRNP)-like protein
VSSSTSSQLIFSAFKTLTNQVVTVELKNDVAVTGKLKSVEGDESRWPHLVRKRERGR